MVITCGRGMVNTGGRGVATPRALGGYSMWAWRCDDLWAVAATTCGPGAVAWPT